MDGNIRDKLVFNLDEGNTIAKAAQPSSVLKVHNIWLKRAKESYEESCRKYVHDTLLNIDFFARLSFE